MAHSARPSAAVSDATPSQSATRSMTSSLPPPTALKHLAGASLGARRQSWTRAQAPGSTDAPASRPLLPTGPARRSGTAAMHSRSPSALRSPPPRTLLFCNPVWQSLATTGRGRLAAPFFPFRAAFWLAPRAHATGSGLAAGPSGLARAPLHSSIASSSDQSRGACKIANYVYVCVCLTEEGVKERVIGGSIVQRRWPKECLLTLWKQAAGP